MILAFVNIRVRYAETDQMGYVYYGNYAQYFEVARVEMLRELGFSYRKLEDSGIHLPVAEYHIRYIRPARYDDLLEIRTRIEHLPGARLEFFYATYNEEGILLNEASTTLVFVDARSGRPCRPPHEMLEAMSVHFR